MNPSAELCNKAVLRSENASKMPWMEIPGEVFREKMMEEMGRRPYRRR
ncbi:hypothetical protein SAMN04488105_11435 [Salipiger thiooxidans]|uniref:Uncharacterized protein n=1 Tax=Salipiger thiooxidans TaxID=282683 RepID=A0A1G7J168_9RHOB|nr:hypothetical protein SAMN04488105_11435 [Salipiger thiooxidans]